MDPLTLFALANGAVSAVKAGCKLYKDIKGAAGDVREVLKDLDEQFHGAFEAKGKTPTVEQRNQFVKEKNRVIELNKKQGDTAGIYTELGEHLGAYYDNYYKCIAIFEEEEKHSKHEIYQGDASLGKRALQRVLMRKQLEQEGFKFTSDIGIAGKFSCESIFVDGYRLSSDDSFGFHCGGTHPHKVKLLENV